MSAVSCTTLPDHNRLRNNVSLRNWIFVVFFSLFSVLVAKLSALSLFLGLLKRIAPVLVDASTVMPSDSSFSHVHMENKETLLFIESWENHKLQWDEVELPNGGEIEQYDNLLQQFLSQNQEAESDIGLINGTNSASFSSAAKQKNRKLNWKDMDLNHFLSDTNHAKLPVIHDQTILNRPKLGQQNHDSLIYGDAESSDIQLRTTSSNVLGEFNLEQSDDEFDNNDNPARNFTNPDLSSRSFLQTPTLNNRVYQLHNFQNSNPRSVSQQRRPSDQNSRNSSYNTSMHGNIR